MHPREVELLRVRTSATHFSFKHILRFMFDTILIEQVSRTLLFKVRLFAENDFGTLFLKFDIDSHTLPNVEVSNCQTVEVAENK